MTKKSKNQIYGMISGFGTLFGFYLWYKFSLGIYGLLTVIFLPNIISWIIISLIPIKETNRNKTTDKNATKKNNQKTNNSHNPTKENKLLRSDDEILTLPFKQLTWREFERLCYLYYKEQGYNVRETKEGADGGIDLIYFDPDNNTDVAVQIKKYSRPVNVDIIRNVDSAKKNHQCVLAEIITTSTYTQDAKVEADARKIEWRDKNWVELKLLKWRKKEAIKRKLV